MDQENNNVITGKIIGSELDSDSQGPSSSPYINPEADRGQINLNHKKNSAVISVFIGLGLILVLATVALASGMWDPLWNPFQPAPDKVVAQAFQNTILLKTAHMKGTENLVVSGEAPKDNGNINFVIEGDMDHRNKDNPKLQLAFNTNISVQGVNFLIEGEARTVDKVSYFKLDTIPAPFSLSLSAMGLDIDAWKGKWISFDPKDLGMSIGASSAQKQKFSKDIQKLLLQYPIAKVQKRLVSEKINNQSTYHYLMAVDKENFKQFLHQLPALIQQDNIIPGASSSTLDPEKEQEMFKSIDDAFAKSGGINFEIWISKKNRLIDKIVFNRTFKASDLGKKGPDKLVLNLEFLYSKFNQPVNIEAPKDSTSIMQLLGPLMQIYMGTSKNMPKGPGGLKGSGDSEGSGGAGGIGGANILGF